MRLLCHHILRLIRADLRSYAIASGDVDVVAYALQ